MATADSKLISIKIVGLITSVAYQKAKYYLQICSRLSHIYSQPVVYGLLEFDWDEYITKQRRKFGGQLWALKIPVAVYYDKKFIGSDKELLKLIGSKYSFSTIVHDTYFRNESMLDYERFIQNTERIYVYLIVTIESGATGALVFQLFSDLLPTTCEIFKNFCSNKTYKSTHFHRLCKMGWIQGGASEDGFDSCERKDFFPDESFCISHNRRGVLSMVNDGRHTNCKQFFITLKPSQWMDYRYIAFGQLVEGVDILAAIEDVETYYEKPLKVITIVKCGVLRPRQTVEADIRAALEAVIPTTESAALERALEADVTDPRDVDSVPNLNMYNQGMYSLQPKPNTKLVL